MRLTFRAKLTIIVGVAAAAFVITIVSSSLLSNRVEELLADVELRQLPRLEIGPRLERRLEQLQRSFQDAVAARDVESLAGTREVETQLLDDILAARGVVTPGEAAVLRGAVEDYYLSALDISRRLVGGETGEALVEAMAAMQSKQAKAVDLTKSITAPDRRQLTESFQAAARAQTAAGRARIVIGGLCMLLVIALSTWMSRGVLRSLAALGTGLRRFGDGNLATPIVVNSQDELADVARQANHMASSLQQLGTERERTDWIRRAQNGLAEELRGELSPAQVAAHGVAFLARTLGAPLGALYATEGDGTLRLLGHYAGSAGTDSGSPNASSEGHPGRVAPSFRPGEGLVGQAAAQREILIISNLPADYLRVRSGLGDAPPLALVLAPLARNDRVIGVVELAFFKPWAAPMRDLLMAVHEGFAIAIEVARARLATRELLAETQRQAARLASQEEVLRATNEELQAQQEELRQTNLDLGRQADELESQRRTLEEQNTDLQEAREGLEQKAAELTTVSNYKSQFLANMSHELRTPLNSMLLLSNLLAENEGKNLTPKQVEFARTVYQAGRDLLTLINQVLDLAKVESGKQELRLETVDLVELGARMERVFGPLVRDKGLRFAVEVAADLPAHIDTDRQRLEQILNNLLGNAIKFTARGQVTLRIERPAKTARFRREDLRPDQAVAFRVSDTGLGIAPADQERIFAPFEQIEATPDRRYGGTGLGLSIARELAVWLGGELGLESTPGTGSTFTCTLPEELRGRAGAVNGTAAIAPFSADATSRESTGGLSEVRAEHHRGAAVEPHLLLIEDDPNFAMAFGEIIRGQGLKYQVASSGRAGLEAARSTHPTGIILDVKLPDVDGWSVLRQLREDPTTAAIPIHFVSALDGAEHGMALGATGYVTKPATRRQLIRVVQSLAPRSPERRPRVLVVEDDAEMGDSLVKQLAGENLEVWRAASAAEALQAVKAERFGCMILDLSLPDMDGLQLLQLLREQCGNDMPSVVVYTGRALTKAETKTLEAYTEAIVLKEGASNERLLDEIRLFVRRLKDGLGARRPATSSPTPVPVRLEGRKVLVVDDDMRTVYALSAMLRSKGADVLAADTGKAALAVLDESPSVDAILMDIMMPEMDGYEAMRRIRQDPRFKDLPIVALTAKAMKGDDEKCREAGATDYLTKPVDADRLLPLLHDRLAEKQLRGS